MYLIPNQFYKKVFSKDQIQQIKRRIQFQKKWFTLKFGVTILRWYLFSQNNWRLSKIRVGNGTFLN